MPKAAAVSESPTGLRAAPEGKEREEPSEALGRGHHPRSARLARRGHASAPFSRLMTDSRRSGGSSTTRSGPNDARYSAYQPESAKLSVTRSQPAAAPVSGVISRAPRRSTT